MDPDIIHDPVFQELLLKFEVAGRKLRDSVIAMRSFYLTHHKSPHEESTSEKWRGAIISEEAAARHQAVEDAAAQLLRYAFEIAPHSNNALHMEELYKLKLAHRERLETKRSGLPQKPHPKGIEERVRIDDGPPVTLVYKPSAWEFTDRGRKTLRRKKPAMHPEDSPPSGEPHTDVESVE